MLARVPSLGQLYAAGAPNELVEPARALPPTTFDTPSTFVAVSVDDVAAPVVAALVKAPGVKSADENAPFGSGAPVADDDGANEADANVESVDVVGSCATCGKPKLLAPRFESVGRPNALVLEPSSAERWCW